MQQVRYGLIGYGNMGTGYPGFIENIPQAKLVAVADHNPQRLEAARQALPNDVAFFDTAEALITCGKLDAVIIATPHYDHPPLARLAFENGLHVLTEKPAGVSAKQVERMNQAADKAGKLFGIMFQNRLVPAHQKLHALLAGGALGEIKRTNLVFTDWYRSQSYYDSGAWRATWAGEGGGVLLNQCPHSLDLWQWCVGMLPVKVSAQVHAGKWHDIEVEDDVTAYVEYANGATGSFVASTADYPGVTRMEITGDLGRVVLEDGKLVHYQSACSEREFNRTYTGGFGTPGCQRIELACPDEYPGHRAVLENFTLAVLGQAELMIDGREGLKSLQLSNAIYLSGWLGRPVEFPVDQDLFEQELQKRVATSRHKTVAGRVLSTQGSY